MVADHHDSSWLDPLLPDPALQRRYLDATRRLLMGREVSALKVAHRARMRDRLPLVRALLLADPRFTPIPSHGPALFRVRDEYRHAARLRELVTIRAVEAI